MVKTGYIAFYTETESVQDANGDWVVGTKTLSDFVECNLRVINKEYINLVDGQVKQASYSMYLDSDSISLDIESISEISLQDNRSNSLGDFQIMNVEYLELSKKIKIVV